MFEAFPLTLNPWLPVGVLSSTFLLIPDPVAASDSPACAESCSDRIIGMDSSRLPLPRSSRRPAASLESAMLPWCFCHQLMLGST